MIPLILKGAIEQYNRSIVQGLTGSLSHETKDVNARYLATHRGASLSSALSCVAPDQVLTLYNVRNALQLLCTSFVQFLRPRRLVTAVRLGNLKFSIPKAPETCMLGCQTETAIGDLETRNPVQC